MSTAANASSGLAAAGALAAEAPAEERGLRRDEVRLLVSGVDGHTDARFYELPDLLRAGDVLIVNRSATLPAALPAHGRLGPFLLHLSTRYGPRLWLAEPRWSAEQPGPVPFATGERVTVTGVEARMLMPYPGLPRLRFVEFAEEPDERMGRFGRPIRYGYLAADAPLSRYQTIFSELPGSAEMPSAARPFSERTLSNLDRAGVLLERVTLHTGVSSLESGDLEWGELYAEPFEVNAATAARLNRAVASGARLIAVGTTVVRALASSWHERHGFLPKRGMTRVFVRPGRPLPPLHGLLTGFHEPGATHLDMLQAVAGIDLVNDSYTRARAGGYLWHEFGDVHLLLPGSTNN